MYSVLHMLLPVILGLLLVQVSSLPSEEDFYESLYGPIRNTRESMSYEVVPDKRYIRFGKRYHPRSPGSSNLRGYIHFG
ncbi:unnamed protein product [Trichobilharzia szidati]|nr:unnamed protein product [Trichobilharzia szidati]